MSSDDTLYSARFLLPTFIERGRDNVIKCAVYRDGSLVAPSSGTVSVYDDGGAAIVNAQAVTVTGSVAQYTVTNAATSGKALDDGWRVEWSLAMPDSVTHLFRNDASLVRAALYPVLTDADLYRRVSSLDPSDNDAITNATTYQQYRDEAWTAIQNRLIAMGNRPALVASPTALREAHLLLTLAYIFEDLSTRLNEAYEGRAEMYRRHYDQEFKRLTFKYESDEEAGTTDANYRRNAYPTVWLGSGRRRWQH